MNYQVLVKVDGKWEVAKELSTLNQAKGFESQCKSGGYETKVQRKPRD